MTLDQLQEIRTNLTKWREQRYITPAMQKEGYITNILEELTEYTRATNDNDKIDALCDIMVFTININHFIPDLVLEKNRYENNSLSTILIHISNISEGNLDFAKDMLPYSLNHILSSIIHICIEMIKNKGYDPYLAMKETIKEISSRTGSYDKNVAKWIKDISDEAKAKWYKADYESCKIKG